MNRVCGGAQMVARECADPRDIRDAVVHDYDPHRINDYVDPIVRPHAEKVADGVFATGRAELLSEYFEPIALLSHAALLGIDPTEAIRLRRSSMALVTAFTNFAGDRTRDA